MEFYLIIIVSNFQVRPASCSIDKIDLDVLFQKDLKIGIHKEACTNIYLLNKLKRISHICAFKPLRAKWQTYKGKQ